MLYLIFLHTAVVLHQQGKPKELMYMWTKVYVEDAGKVKKVSANSENSMAGR